MMNGAQAVLESLKREGVPMLLLGWNFMYEKDHMTVYWRTDPSLRELSGYYVAMEEVAEKYPPKRHSEKNLFMLPYNPHPSQKRNVWNTYLKNIIASLDEAGSIKNKSRCEKSPAVARLG